MEYVNLHKISATLSGLKEKWNNAKPFRYLVIDGFLHPDKADEAYKAYPDLTSLDWDNTTYINQKNKFQKRDFEADSFYDLLFKELNSEEFLKTIEDITGIRSLLPDRSLFGGGLHQSVKGAFLDIHIDYNIHPETKKHRRLNILIYLNQDWRPEYNGDLELWDMKKKKCIEKIHPDFNRCVIFETNNISFHGHPRPLNTPDSVSRKSIAAYYYTATRPRDEIKNEHSTIYVNVNGLNGLVKNLKAGFLALKERLT
ncbi:MAG: 2OG-Fe(II) oxygenase [Cyclobacteriaceae bacterium]